MVKTYRFIIAKWMQHIGCEHMVQPGINKVSDWSLKLHMPHITRCVWLPLFVVNVLLRSWGLVIIKPKEKDCWEKPQCIQLWDATGRTKTYVSLKTKYYVWEVFNASSFRLSIVWARLIFEGGKSAKILFKCALQPFSHSQ